MEHNDILEEVASMNINFKDMNGRPLPLDIIGKVVIYGDGKKLFERENDLEASEYYINSYGNKQLRSVYNSSPLTVILRGPVKDARKENLNRRDNYTLRYTPEHLPWERRTALYIHRSEINITDLGDLLAFETDEERNYLHAVKLQFTSPVVFERLHAEHIQVPGDWKLPEGCRWSDCYGTEEHPCYDTYDFTDSHHEKLRAKGKGVIKRWRTFETVEDAEYICAERYYTKTEESPDRLRKRAIAEKLNNSKEYSADKWSHYDITKLENALGYKLSLKEA